MIDRMLEAVLAPLDALMRWVVVACMATMATVVSAQVFTRYVLNTSIDWADEVSRLAFICSIFLAMALGVRQGAHVSIDLLTARLPARLREALRRATCLLSAGLLMVVAVQTVIVAQVTWSERLGALSLTSSAFFIPVAVGCVHAALHLLWLALAPAPSAESTA